MPAWWNHLLKDFPMCTHIVKFFHYLMCDLDFIKFSFSCTLIREINLSSQSLESFLSHVCLLSVVCCPKNLSWFYRAAQTVSSPWPSWRLWSFIEMKNFSPSGHSTLLHVLLSVRKIILADAHSVPLLIASASFSLEWLFIHNKYFDSGIFFRQSEVKSFRLSYI